MDKFDQFKYENNFPLKYINWGTAKYYFTRKTHSFIKNHDLILKTLCFNEGLGSLFNIENNQCLNIGLGRRKEFILHELGHIIVSPNEDLFKQNYGLPISKEYSYEALMIEQEVFRHEITLHQIINERLYGTKIRSALLSKKQLNLAFKGSEDQKEEIYKESKRAFLTPITKQDEQNTLQKLNEKLLFLQQFNPNPTHFIYNMNNYMKPENE